MKDELVASATLRITKEDFRFDGGPTCPLCGKKMARMTLVMDFGVVDNPASIMHPGYTRQITEQTIWMCEVSCDVTSLVNEEPKPRKVRKPALMVCEKCDWEGVTSDTLLGEDGKGFEGHGYWEVLCPKCKSPARYKNESMNRRKEDA